MHTKKYILTCLLACLTSFLFAQTSVSGGIYTNTTWTLANSPYRITGNIVVFPGATLTIEPGVRVYVDEMGPVTTNQFSLEVRGSLSAIGTPGQQIIFQATNDSTTLSTWRGIDVKSNQGGQATIAYTTLNNSYFTILYENFLFYPRVIEGCSFNYNSYGFSSFGHTTLRNCTFSNNAVGLNGTFGFDSLRIENCTFTGNAVGANAYSNVLVARNCVFLNNYQAGLAGGARVSTIQNCSFTGNLHGIRETNAERIDSCFFTQNQVAIQSPYYSRIRRNIITQNGVGVEAGIETLTEFNQINANSVGVKIVSSLTAQDVQPIIVNNEICNNTLYNVENGSNLNYALDSNCFCLPDSAAIDAKIYDGYDDISRGLVNFSIYDSTCSNIIGTVTKVFIPTEAGTPLEARIEVYPNPSQGQAILRLAGAESGLTGQLLDLQGRALQVFSLQGDQHALDLSTLPDGLYLVRLSATDGRQWTQRIVKR
jgi:hypothetical protein